MRLVDIIHNVITELCKKLTPRPTQKCLVGNGGCWIDTFGAIRNSWTFNGLWLVVSIDIEKYELSINVRQEIKHYAVIPSLSGTCLEFGWFWRHASLFSYIPRYALSISSNVLGFKARSNSMITQKFHWRKFKRRVLQTISAYKKVFFQPFCSL